VIGVFIQSLVSGLIYMISAGIISILFSLLFKSINSDTKYGSRLFGIVLGIFAALLFLQPYLTDIGIATLNRLDPAYYIGYFTINPIKVLSAEYGASRMITATLSSFTIALGFIVVRVIGSVSGLLNNDWKIGLISSILFIALGFLYGAMFDKTGNATLAIPVIILSFLVYVITPLFRNKPRLKEGSETINH
jgi:hypothetical protein